MTDDEVDQQVRLIMFEIMSTLYKHGITEIHVGGFMRILGVSPELAAEHDDELITLDENFAKYVKQITEPRPSDQTLH